MDSKTMIIEIKRRFPSFEITEEMDGLPTVISSFFVHFIITNVNEKNENLVKEIVQFVDELAKSADGEVQASFEDITIGLYDSPKINYDDFKKLLSSNTQKSMDHTISFWNRQS